jgi:allophanate hydrolase subunit 1
VKKPDSIGVAPGAKALIVRVRPRDKSKHAMTSYLASAISKVTKLSKEGQGVDAISISLMYVDIPRKEDNCDPPAFQRFGGSGLRQIEC